MCLLNIRDATVIQTKKKERGKGVDKISEEEGIPGKRREGGADSFNY